jgi:NAD(P)-dependent dehydrogenase (short-subunit alcohol dehydrogenase family)
MRVALVTGAARGLGQAYARGLAGRGFRVAVADLADVSETVRLAGEEHCRGFRADVTDPEQIAALLREIESTLGPVDVLVNNVGAFPFIPFLDLTYDDWRRMQTINLDSVFLMCRAVVPGMVARGYGRIVNIASGTVFKGTANVSAYVAAKAGVIGLTRVLATELGRHGITVNCVAPGLTDTPGAQEYTDGLKHESTNLSRRAISRREVPEDVVGAVLFFTSDDSAFVTGQTMLVDGGDVKH